MTQIIIAFFLGALLLTVGFFAGSARGMFYFAKAAALAEKADKVMMELTDLLNEAQIPEETAREILTGKKDCS